MALKAPHDLDLAYISIRHAPLSTLTTCISLTISPSLCAFIHAAFSGRIDLSQFLYWLTPTHNLKLSLGTISSEEPSLISQPHLQLDRHIFINCNSPLFLGYPCIYHLLLLFSFPLNCELLKAYSILYLQCVGQFRTHDRCSKNVCCLLSLYVLISL